MLVKLRRLSCPCAGFTTIELMVVVAVLAVIGAVAAPGMQSFVLAQRVQSLSYDLASDLMLARSEALKRSSTAQLSASGTGLEGGWRVSAGNTVLGWRGATAGGVQISDAPITIAFNSNGRVSAPVTQLRMTISAGDSPGIAKRCIQVDLSGRVRALTGACT